LTEANEGTKNRSRSFNRKGAKIKGRISANHQIVLRFAIANPSFRPRVHYGAIESVWFMGNIRKTPTPLTSGVVLSPRKIIRRTTH
jgi:hypothetical protein